MTDAGPPQADGTGDERYQQLVELAPDGILVHEDGRIVLANAAAVRLAGATDRAQLIGTLIDSLLEPPYLKAAQLQLTRAEHPTNLAVAVRDTLHRLDGSEVQVEVRAVAFMERGHLSAHLVIRDISDRLAAEHVAWQLHEGLQQAAKSEAIGRLAGGVAHEVNNMMSVIIGFSAFLLKEKGAPFQRTSDVREIMKAAQRAAEVTRQLLAFSRTAVHRPEVVDIGHAVRDAEPALRAVLGDDRPLDVLAHGAGAVWIDPGQFDEVILNLALNARDATPAGGSLTVSSGQREVAPGITAVGGAMIPAGRYATVVVRDTGVGMDATTQARIFEPFFTTKGVGEGTGLGLSAVHGILTQSGGYITVASALGQGSAFTLYLPVVSAEDEPPDQEEPPPPRVAPPPFGTTALVVDDEPAVRTVAARILQQSGLHVLQAAHGEDALDMIERHGPPQLVLTDLMMPGIGGAELARRLKEQWPAVRVIFMSGFSAEALTRAGEADIVGELIEKPFTPDGLMMKVNAALGRAAA